MLGAGPGRDAEPLTQFAGSVDRTAPAPRGRQVHLAGMNMLASVRAAVIASAPLLLGLSAACSSSTDAGDRDSDSNGSNGSSGGDDSPAIAEDTCLARCESKVSGCEAPPSMVRQACDGLCDSSPTRAELECLEARSCRELEADGGTSCKGAGSGSSSSGSTSSTSGSSQPRVPLGGICDCNGAQRCMDTQRGPCEGSLTCLDYLRSDNDNPDPDFQGVCSRECTGDDLDNDCPSGFTCSLQTWDRVDIGSWCVRE